MCRDVSHLVAGEAQDDEASILVLVIDCLQP